MINASLLDQPWFGALLKEDSLTETHRVQIDQKDTTVVVVDDGSVDSAAAVVVEVDVDLVLSSAQK